MSVAAKKTHKLNSYFDPTTKLWTIKILPGECYVCEPAEMVVTTLGSCVSACIRDRVLGIGGMNHFMLAESEQGEWAGDIASTRFGNFAMEYLINEILKRGGRRENLEAKIFGGASMNTGGEKVGSANIDFAMAYLKTEKIKILAEDVGGEDARKVYFKPDNGTVQVKRLRLLANDTIQKREKELAVQINSNTQDEGDVELF